MENNGESLNAPLSFCAGLAFAHDGTGRPNTGDQQPYCATRTACIRQGDGPACPATATSTSLVGTNLPIGEFIVTRMLTGIFVSQIAIECNQLNKGSKENFILTVLNGTINGTTYQLGFFTPYSGPGVYHEAGTDKTVVFLVNTKNSTGLANLGKLAMTITITNGGRAGFLDADLGNLKAGTPVLGHATGQYSCSA